MEDAATATATVTAAAVPTEADRQKMRKELGDAVRKMHAAEAAARTLRGRANVAEDAVVEARGELIDAIERLPYGGVIVDIGKGQGVCVMKRVRVGEGRNYEFVKMF